MEAILAEAQIEQLTARLSAPQRPAFRARIRQLSDLPGRDGDLAEFLASFAERVAELWRDILSGSAATTTRRGAPCGPYVLAAAPRSPGLASAARRSSSFAQSVPSAFLCQPPSSAFFGASTTAISAPRSAEETFVTN